MTFTVLFLGLAVACVLCYRDLLSTASATYIRLARQWREFRQAARDFQNDLDRWL